jgi:hypothetical protein
MLMMSDALSDGIVKQFPKFAGFSRPDRFTRARAVLARVSTN